MIFNFIIESYLKHLLFYFQTFLHTLAKNLISKMILSLIFKTHLLKQQNAANNIGGADGNRTRVQN